MCTPDPKHAANVVTAMGVEQAKGVDTPGSLCTGENMDGADEVLEKELAREAASAIGTVTCVSLDRPEMQYQARELAMGIPAPMN